MAGREDRADGGGVPPGAGAGGRRGCTRRGPARERGHDRGPRAGPLCAGRRTARGGPRTGLLRERERARRPGGRGAAHGGRVTPHATTSFPPRTTGFPSTSTVAPDRVWPWENEDLFGPPENWFPPISIRTPPRTMSFWRKPNLARGLRPIWRYAIRSRSPVDCSHCALSRSATASPSQDVTRPPENPHRSRRIVRPAQGWGRSNATAPSALVLTGQTSTLPVGMPDPGAPRAMPPSSTPPPDACGRRPATENSRSVPFGAVTCTWSPDSSTAATRLPSAWSFAGGTEDASRIIRSHAGNEKP